MTIDSEIRKFRDRITSMGEFFDDKPIKDFKLALLEIIKGVKCGHDEKEEFINKICPHCRSRQEGADEYEKAITELFNREV